MPFNPFGPVENRHSSLFEIRPDNDIIVLRGGEDEAASQILRGVVVLCLQHSLKIEDVHLKMVGTLKVAWHDQRITPTGLSNNKVDRTTEIFNKKWAPFETHGPGSSMKVLKAGNYEWPFEVEIPGTMAESVEGMQDSYIKYKLKATVARGKLAQDLHAYKAIRIVRTLDPSALELAHAMTVENVWPNKIEYSLEIPQKAIIFGSSIDICMRFTSLLKGLKIGKIKCVLQETQDFTLSGLSGHSERSWKNVRDVASWVFELNDDEHYHDVLDENGQDGWRLVEKMSLPISLEKCLQDVDVHGIKIRHKVKFNVALLNPDGHISELRATLPVTIYISPNMPFNENNCLIQQAPLSGAPRDTGAQAPPLYGEHVLDQLYAGMDQDLMTPQIRSGANTPFLAQSRRGSSENLASLNSAVETSGAPSAADLNQRLQELNMSSRNSSIRNLRRGWQSGGSTPHDRHAPDGDSGYFDASHSNSHSQPLSRRISEEEDHPVSNLPSGTHTPEHNESFDDLKKVPSYNTAVKAPVRGMSYSDMSALPSYTPPRTDSAPGSPSATFSQPMSSSARERHLPHLHTTTSSDNDIQRRAQLMFARERAH